MSPINERGSLPLTRLDPDRCPRCKTSLIGDPIPGKDREFFGGRRTHFRRDIGYEVEGYDGVCYLACPDCGWAWSDWVGGRGEGSMTAWARKHVDEHNARLRDDWPELRDRFVERAAGVAAAYEEHAQLRPTAWRCNIPSARIHVLIDWREGLDFARLAEAERVSTALVGVNIQTDVMRPDREGMYGPFDPWPREPRDG